MRGPESREYRAWGLVLGWEPGRLVRLPHRTGHPRQGSPEHREGTLERGRSAAGVATPQVVGRRGLLASDVGRGSHLLRQSPTTAWRRPRDRARRGRRNRREAIATVRLARSRRHPRQTRLRAPPVWCWYLAAAIRGPDRGRRRLSQSHGRRRRAGGGVSRPAPSRWTPVLTIAAGIVQARPPRLKGEALGWYVAVVTWGTGA